MLQHSHVGCLSPPAEGDLKSGIPALTEIPAPHMITMFLYSPPLKNEMKIALQDIEEIAKTYLSFLTISSSCNPSLFDELPPMLKTVGSCC